MLAYLKASLQEKCLPYTKATSSTHIYIYIYTHTLWTLRRNLMQLLPGRARLVYEYWTSGWLSAGSAVGLYALSLANCLNVFNTSLQRQCEAAVTQHWWLCTAAKHTLSSSVVGAHWQRFGLSGYACRWSLEFFSVGLSEAYIIKDQPCSSSEYKATTYGLPQGGHIYTNCAQHDIFVYRCRQIYILQFSNNPFLHRATSRCSPSSETSCSLLLSSAWLPLAERRFEHQVEWRFLCPQVSLCFWRDYIRNILSQWCHTEAGVDGGSTVCRTRPKTSEVKLLTTASTVLKITGSETVTSPISRSYSLISACCTSHTF